MKDGNKEYRNAALNYASDFANKEVSIEVMKAMQKAKPEVKVDITEVIETAPPSGGGEEEPDVGVPGSEIHIEVPVPEDKVVVDDLEPGTDEGDGGIGGDVDDWDDETDVELPVN